MEAAPALRPLSASGVARAATARPALFVPAPLAKRADAVLAELAALAPLGRFADLSGAQLLAERAQISGHVSNGKVSPAGSCRLLEVIDGWIALNLARDEDWSLLAAWLEGGDLPDWDAVARAVRGRGAKELVERGREMGLAAAVDEMPRSSFTPLSLALSPHAGRGDKKPRVVDLSSLWAGPLCGHLLQRLGAQVIKVESVHRPDGARRGPPAFFDLLNAGKASVALDFSSEQGRLQLRELIESADIVIEASRPRALRQLGIDAQAYARTRVWLSITAYGRAPARENWIGYGDEVAVAAGLSALIHEATGERVIAGDAVADPLTGLHAALAAANAFRAGQTGVLDISLYEVMRSCLSEARDDWGLAAPAPVRPRRTSGIARPLGADNVVHLREAGLGSAGQTSEESAGAVQ